MIKYDFESELTGKGYSVEMQSICYIELYIRKQYIGLDIGTNPY